MKPNGSMAKSRLVRPSISNRLSKSTVSQHAAKGENYELSDDSAECATNTIQWHSSTKEPKSKRSLTVKGISAPILGSKVLTKTKSSSGKPPRAQRRAAVKASKQLESSRPLAEKDDVQDDSDFDPYLRKRSRKTRAAKAAENKMNDAMQNISLKSSATTNAKKSNLRYQMTSPGPLTNDKSNIVSPGVARNRYVDTQHRQDFDDIPEATTHFDDAFDPPGDHIVIDGVSESVQLLQAHYPLAGQSAGGTVVNKAAAKRSKTVQKSDNAQTPLEENPMPPPSNEDPIGVAKPEKQANTPPIKPVLANTQAHPDRRNESVKLGIAFHTMSNAQIHYEVDPSTKDLPEKATHSRMKPPAKLTKVVQHQRSHPINRNASIRCPSQQHSQAEIRDTDEKSLNCSSKKTHPEFETPVNSHRNRKPILIGFSSSGPRNQGILSKNKRELVTQKDMEAFATESTDVTNVSHGEPVKRKLSIQLSNPQKRLKVAPLRRGLKSECRPAKTLDKTTHERSVQKSQGSRVEANGSPIPVSQPNAVPTTSLGQISEYNEINDQITIVDYDDFDNEIYTDLSAARKPLDDIHVSQKDRASLRSGSSKQIPSSPLAPSNLLTNSEAHQLHPSGVLTNVANDKVLRSQDLHDPFQVPGELKESSFTKLLRNANQVKLVEQQKDLTANVSSGHLGDQGRAIHIEDTETLVNENQDQDDDEVMQDQSSDVQEADSGSDADGSDNGQSPTREDVESSDDWVLRISNHQTDLLGALFGISRVRNIHFFEMMYVLIFTNRHSSVIS